MAASQTKQNKTTGIHRFLQSTGVFFFFFFNIFFFVPLVFSAPSNIIHYQGKLTDTSNVPVSDGSYSFKITLWDSASGGSCLWSARGTCGTPTAKSLSTVSGIFSTVLGEAGDNALSLDFNSDYYLQIQIDADSPMTPRRKVAASGYAINATKLNGQASTYYLDTSSTDQIKSGGLTVQGNTVFGNDTTNFVSIYGGNTSGDIRTTSGNALTLTPASGQNLNINLATTGDFAVNTNQLYVDTSTGYVGIGTASPGAKLDEFTTFSSATAGEQFGLRARSEFSIADTGLKQGLRVEAIAKHTSGTIADLYGAVILGVKSNVSTSPVSRAMGIFTRVDNNNASGAITDAYGLYIDDSIETGTITNDYGVYQVDTGAINYFGGKVGIGTTSPGAKFVTTSSGSTDPVHIHSPSQTPWAMRIFNDTYSASTPIFDFYPQNDGTFLMGTNVATSLQFYTNSYSNTRMTIDSSGNVGIGAASAGARLYVSNSVTSASNPLFQVTDSSAANSYIKFSDGTSASNQFIPTMEGRSVGTGFSDRTGLIISGLLSEDGSDDWGMRFISKSDSSTTLVNAPTFAWFNHSTEQMRISASGNVGIGTTSPGSNKLSIYTAGSENAQIALGASGTGRSGIYFDASNGDIVGADYGSLVQSDDLSVQLNNYGNNPLYFRTSDADRMTILGSGNIGIGDTSPSALLTVGNGDLFQINSSGAIAAATGITSSGTISFSGIANDGAEATALLLNGSNQLVYRELGSNAFTSTGYANTALSNLASVAINTSLLPASDDSIDLGDSTHRFRDLYLGGDTLHLGTSTTDEATFAYNTTANVLNIGTDSTTNGDIAFFTDDLYLDKSTGRVGVGITSPGAILDVYNNSSSTALKVAQAGTGSIFSVYDNTDEVMRVEDGGNIVIGDKTVSSSSWSTSHDGSQESILALAVYDGKLYAGQGTGSGDGDVLVYDGSSWTTSYDGVQEFMMSLAVYDGKLYAGQGGTSAGDGDVYVFDGSSWTQSYNGSTERVQSLAVYDGKLYAGVGDNNSSLTGDVYVFDGSSWTQSYNGSQGLIESLAVYDGKLYAGEGNGSGDGNVVVFNGTSWTTSYNGAQEEIYGLAVYDGKLYATQGWSAAGDGDVLVYDGSSWTTSYDGAQENMYGIGVYNGKLYAGEGNETGDGDILVYDGSSWTTSYNGSQERLYALTEYNGSVYAGQGNGTGDGDVLVMTEAQNKSYPLQFAVGTGASQKTGSLWFSDEDLYGTSGGPGANVGVFKMSHSLITTAGAYDIAEDYPTNDAELLPGTVVAVDETTNGFVVSANKESSVIGVVSTRPGFRLSGERVSGISVPVALAGRVPVKVTGENGNIHRGDRIVLSRTKDGYATKATSGNDVSLIGYALESWDVEDEYSVSTIEISLHIQNASQVVISNSTLAESGMDPTLQNQMNLLKEESKTIMDFYTSLNLGAMVFADEKGDVNLLGNLSVKDIMAEHVDAKEMTVQSVSIKNNTNDSTVGTVVIPSGETKQMIKTTAVSKNSKIFVTPSGKDPIAIPITVMEKVEGEGFSLGIASSVSNDISVDWWIVNEE